MVVTDFEMIKQLLGKTSAADRPPGLFQLMPNGVGRVKLLLYTDVTHHFVDSPCISGVEIRTSQLGANGTLR